jgi:hypothetical protein
MTAREWSPGSLDGRCKGAVWAGCQECALACAPDRVVVPTADGCHMAVFVAFLMT